MVEITEERYRQLLMAEMEINRFLNFIEDKRRGYSGISYSELKLLADYLLGEEEEGE